MKSNPARKRRAAKLLAAPAMINFLRIDTQTGLIFSGIALGTDDLEKKERTTRMARKAHDTVLRLKLGIGLTDADNHRLQRSLERLKGKLEMLGERF